MLLVYIVEMSTSPGVWEVCDKIAYTNEKTANEVALRLMEISNKKIASRVTALKIMG